MNFYNRTSIFSYDSPTTGLVNQIRTGSSQQLWSHVEKVQDRALTIMFVYRCDGKPENQKATEMIQNIVTFMDKNNTRIVGFRRGSYGSEDMYPYFRGKDIVTRQVTEIAALDLAETYRRDGDDENNDLCIRGSFKPDSCQYRGVAIVFTSNEIQCFHVCAEDRKDGLINKWSYTPSDVLFRKKTLDYMMIGDVHEEKNNSIRVTYLSVYDQQLTMGEIIDVLYTKVAAADIAKAVSDSADAKRNTTIRNIYSI